MKHFRVAPKIFPAIFRRNFYPLSLPEMMLRSTLLLAATLLVFACSSCVHEYTCQCKIKYSGQPGLPDSTIREYSIRDTKDKAKAACEQNSSQSTDQTTHITTNEDCKLF